MAGKICSCAAGQFCGASLKDGAAAVLDFLPTVGQIGEEAAHFLPDCGTVAQALVGGGFLACPAPNSFVSVEVWAVAGQVDQAQA